MDTQPDQLEPSTITPVPAESAGSKRDFWIGFIGWWVVNLCAYGSLAGAYFAFASSATSDYLSLLNTLINSLGCLTFLVNIGALIFFAFRRKQIAFGMLVAFAISIAISILLGVVAMAFCFYIIGQYNNM